MTRRITLRVLPPMPFGDVTMVPPALSRRPVGEMVRAMARAGTDMPTAASVLNRAYGSLPLGLLNARVAALASMVDRMRRSA
jgi:hypothetical protein